MRRTLAIGLSAVLALAAVGCGGEPEPVTHTGNRFDKMKNIRGIEPTKKGVNPGPSGRSKR
jgi:hypothetical protein